jgi:protein SMG6
LNPALPASLRDIPTRYNIIIRLWTHGIHTLLESLRRASFTSPLALEHLIDFIYYAYSFYTGLLEESTYKSFRSNWLEALGDLARYRMAVAAMVNGSKGGGEALTAAALSSVLASGSPAPSNGVKSKANSTPSVERLDGSPSPSVGLAAAKLLDLEPEKDRWRIIARDWYGLGLTDTPGTGKLHHHLGLLSRDLENEEMRGVYHFVKRFVF